MQQQQNTTSVKSRATRKRPRLSVVPTVPVYYTPVSLLPLGITTDDCTVLRMNDRSLEGFGIFPDDQLLADCKSEVRSGDIVVWHISDNPKGLRHVRRFYTSPGNRVRFERTEDGERKAIVYKREEVVIVGRVFSVERDGRVVKTFPASGVIGGEL